MRVCVAVGTHALLAHPTPRCMCARTERTSQIPVTPAAPAPPRWCACRGQEGGGEGGRGGAGRGECVRTRSRAAARSPLACAPPPPPPNPARAPHPGAHVEDEGAAVEGKGQVAALQKPAVARGRSTWAASGRRRSPRPPASDRAAPWPCRRAHPHTWAALAGASGRARRANDCAPTSPLPRSPHQLRLARGRCLSRGIGL